VSRGLPAPLWALLGVVLGFVAGGVGPRRDLDQEREAREAVQADLDRANRRAARSNPLSVVGLDRAGAPRQQASAAPRSPPTGPAPQDLDEAPARQPQAPSDTGAGGAQGDTGAPADRGADFDMAVDAQRLRIDQSRAALIEQADLSDAQVTELDATMAEMNTRLGAMSADLVALALTADDPDSRELLGVTHDVTGVLYDAQVAMDDIIGPDAAGNVDPQAHQVWNYIDLEGFRGAVEASGGLGSPK